MTHATGRGMMRGTALVLALLVAGCGRSPSRQGEGHSPGSDTTAPGAETEGTAGVSDSEGPRGGAGAPGPGPRAMEGMGAMAGGDGDGAVRLTADEIRRSGFTFGEVRIRDLEKRIRAVGIVEFDETRMAYVAPKFGGWAERLVADFTGQAVRRGQVLAEVYSPELVAAQDELLLARSLSDSLAGGDAAGAGEGAAELLSSARRRLRYWDVPGSVIDGILASGEARRTLPVLAPMSGIVMEKNVFPGQAFQPGTNLYMIADLARVWVNAELFESDAALLREGMRAEVAVAALPGRSFRGTVDFVYPSLREETRSLRARVSLDNPEGVLKPGMYATVGVTAPLGRVLTVPVTAVLHTGERAVVFESLGGGRMAPREVTLGLRDDAHVQVLEGLEEGRTVVTSAQFILDAEANVAEVMRAMMAQMNMTDMQGMDMDMGGMEMDGTGDMDMGGDGDGGAGTATDTTEGEASGGPGAPLPDFAPIAGDTLRRPREG